MENDTILCEELVLPLAFPVGELDVATRVRRGLSRRNWTGTNRRGSERARLIAQDFRCTADGQPVTLVDLSRLGAQVAAEVTVRPGQSVVLNIVRGHDMPTVVLARVKWLRLEPGAAHEGRSSRCGLVFEMWDVRRINEIVEGGMGGRSQRLAA